MALEKEINAIAADALAIASSKVPPCWNNDPQITKFMGPTWDPPGSYPNPYPNLNPNPSPNPNPNPNH